MHSFTQAWKGVPRPWAVGVLWDKDPRLAQARQAQQRMALPSRSLRQASIPGPPSFSYFLSGG